MKIMIDEREVMAYPGEAILEVCRRENIFIPTLCYHPAFKGQGACRMCMVEIIDSRGQRKLVASCTYPVSDGLKVITSSEKIRKIRKTLAMLIAGRAQASPFAQKMAGEYEVKPFFFKGFENEKCILCRLCVNACEEMGSAVLAAVSRGVDKRIETPYAEGAEECIGCKACAEICPTGAIEVKEENGQRIIWHKTFDLIKCESCGREFATPEQIRFIEDKTGRKIEKFLCEGCRKRQTAEVIKEFSV
ncbi:2Fe-2S iron-sulfur cluster-binding protein [Thermosyntropha sp.]|uniref:2Fe-2S iron-sulfur cluster-binding protein n=1 Tax=Thermosyntropha sp. TaxID=2740820 RepID=UPI0025E56B2B|nr:2Fe-2S iron-sulfur cluster-binding protein [Thermosyntropha sp.]MBO8158744.1 (2Fe-2S)-binding protein [Thermosyntropha sp.]